VIPQLFGVPMVPMAGPDLFQELRQRVQELGVTLGERLVLLLRPGAQMAEETKRFNIDLGKL
jgi:hypothetical protein